MATAILLTLPEHGHINATLPLVAELVRRGDRIEYWATEPYRAAIEQAGATFVGYGPEERFAPPAHAGGLYSVMAYLAGLAEEILPRLFDHLTAARPDYLLVDSMCIWGQLAARRLGLPAITLGSVFVPNEAVVDDDALIDQAYGRAPREVVLAGIDALDTYLAISQRIDRRFGTESPGLTGFFAGRQPLNILFTSREFHPDGERYDDSYRFVGPGIAPRGTAPAPAIEDDGRPLVYVSMGTIFNEQAAFYRACLDALADRACRVVMATGTRVDAADLGTIPANAIVREHVPQLEVLALASLFLTHGGMNSVSEALWHGVPLIVHPQHGDQHLVAARVAALGAGRIMTPADVTPARIGALVDAVLADPTFGAGARRMRASFTVAGGAPAAADAILAFTRMAV